MSEALLAQLRETGWAALAREASTPRLAELLVELGATKIAGCVNRATAAGSARPDTLSARYGLGDFPLHTDGADLDQPPRYVLLASTAPRTAATLVLSLRRRPGPLSDEKHALFRVSGRQRFHYARFRESRPSGPMVRYNAATHTPVNDVAGAIVATIAASAPIADRVDWMRAGAVVIDNWACLHRRERVGDTERGRMRGLHIWTRP